MDHDAASFALLTLADWSEGHGLHQASYALEQALVAAGKTADNVELAAELRNLAAGHCYAGRVERREREREADEAALKVALSADVPPHPVEVVVTEEPSASPAAAHKPAGRKRAHKPAGRKRAHQPDGAFKADDPATPDVNEAFVDGGSAAT